VTIQNCKMPTVSIRGEGIAGYCCTRLLREAGVDTTVEAVRRSHLPAIMLGETTQRLLRDVFGREDLIAGFPQIRRRVVAWGPETNALTLSHSAVVVSEKELLERIQDGLGECGEAKSDQPDWTVFASSPLPPVSVEHPFGSRPAEASGVTLQPKCDREACWIESVENGWLFLLPGSKGTGWLLSVGDSVESLLAASRLIKAQLANVDPPRAIFLSHPRVSLPLSALGWVACGTAALGFDPLCGDGTGNAVREAILASAMIRAVLTGGDPPSLIAYYQARLLAGFQRHMALCLDFYKSGCCGPWWDRQLDDLKRGLMWCTAQLQGAAASRYRLNGFVLEPAE
jgi:hypothetical protein